MRVVEPERADADARKHYLILLTPESLARIPLDVPLFAVSGGRHARPVSCCSEEGIEVLRSGQATIWVGVASFLGAPVRDLAIDRVLEGIEASLPPATTEFDRVLRQSLTAHRAQFACQPGPANGAAA